ncbi:MAG: PilZ domain-containing protein [Desulfobacterales bacterium]
MIENKRKHFRLNSLNLSHVGVYENDLLVRQGMGRTLNVSESGILLETNFPINHKSNVLLSIGLEEDLVDIKGNIVHTILAGKDKYKTGIKINNITKPGLEIVKGYISDFTSKIN